MKCNVARDILPLYFDGLCSEETRKQLEEHIEHCENCKQLKQTLEFEQDWTDENQEWDKPIVPLKKVRKKIRRKNIIIAVCIFFLLLIAGATSILTYGQITKKGVSFEMIYDAVRFRQVGKQFAAGNIEPLFETLSDGYLLQDEESAVVRLAYEDSEAYAEDMKAAIQEKYHQYFDGKNLTYKGIEEISYLETLATGGNRTLYLSLRFEGKDQIEYYIVLYKTLNGQYLADDYFGSPYLSYTGDDGTEEAKAGGAETYHTDDTLFSCLPNQLKDTELCMTRYMVLVSGQRALQGDTSLAENGQMRLSIISEQDLTDGTDYLRQGVNEKLADLTEVGYYLTDITCSVKEYDKTEHLYRYQINMELTDEAGSDEIIVAVDCYRISENFVYIPGTERIYGNDLSEELVQTLETLYE